MSSSTELLIKEILQTNANETNSIVSYRKDTDDEYVFLIVNEAVVGTALRMMWFLVYRPTMKIVDSGRDKISHSMTLVQAAMGDVIAHKHTETLDRAMATLATLATLEIEKWLTES